MSASFVKASIARRCVLTNSGTAEAPLVFRVFPGETVMLSGCDPVTGWTPEEGNIYSAAAPMRLGYENQVFAGRKMLFEARWPDAGKSVPEGLLEFNTATMEKGTTPTKIVDDALPDVDLSRRACLGKHLQAMVLLDGRGACQSGGRHRDRRQLRQRGESPLQAGRRLLSLWRPLVAGHSRRVVLRQRFGKAADLERDA